MISVIVYGRNDVHGYNAHRRLALSLNCMAEVLTHPDDEIVFVDYNTPDELPTLIEAVADTLTARCLSTLRVLRVRPETHHRRYAAHTHLPIVEPVARNIAARRSNPANRWLLSTTTDMILVPLSERSVSETCADLRDGFYGLPRFELPEWLWEQIPRSEARRALEEISRLGPALRLDETTTSHEEMRFDAPGDFQLMLRDEFFAIDGFDEAMLLGWHVDTNLSKRLFLRRGSIESLGESVAGYHCNHHRIPTVYHGTALANDLQRFFYDLDRSDVPAQRDTWGLVDEEIEELVVGERANAEFTAAALAACEGSGVAPSAGSDATQERFSLEYDSRHALPFVVDALRTAPRTAVVAYVGANHELERLLAAFVATWNRSSLLVASLDDPAFAAAVDEAADVVVADLGVDAAILGAPLVEGSGVEFTRTRRELVCAYELLRQIVALERARLEAGRSPRRFVLVNSGTQFWSTFVLANLDCGSTTPYSRVRNAVVKREPIESEAVASAEEHAARLVRWLGRDDSPTGRIVVDQDVARVRRLSDYSGFGSGWWYPDWWGIWTSGARSELSVELGQGSRGAVELTFVFDALRLPAPGVLDVTMHVNGEPLSTRTFTNAVPADQPASPGSRRRPARRAVRDLLAAVARRARAAGVPGVDWTIGTVRRLRSSGRRPPEGQFRWGVSLPENAFHHGKLDLVLAVAEPVDWEDDRRLGLYLSGLEVERQP